MRLKADRNELRQFKFWVRSHRTILVRLSREKVLIFSRNTEIDSLSTSTKITDLAPRAQCLDTKSTGSGIQVQDRGILNLKSKDIKNRFPNSIGRGSCFGAPNRAKLSAFELSCNNS